MALGHHTWESPLDLHPNPPLSPSEGCVLPSNRLDTHGPDDTVLQAFDLSSHGPAVPAAGLQTRLAPTFIVPAPLNWHAPPPSPKPLPRGSFIHEGKTWTIHTNEEGVSR